MKTRQVLCTAAITLLLAIAMLSLLGASTAEATKLYWGIGTGLTRLNIDGTQGLNLGALGPVEADVDLDPDDIADLMESAIGGGGYVTDGKWMVQFKAVKLKLGGDPSGTLPNGNDFTGEWSFDITGAEVLVGYPAYTHPKGKVVVQPYVGARYTKHELGVEVTVDDGEMAAGVATTASRSVDHNWTDVIIGSTLKVVLAPKWTWSTRVDGGFGGSNGTFNFGTGVSWKFWKHMSAGPSFAFTAVDFENGEKGDDDWYLYDVNEFGMGFSFMFHF